jgi:curved DNA-binding protein CbpA
VSELKQIYHIKSLLHHPDKNPGHLGAATKLMQEINSAYTLIVKSKIEMKKKEREND